MLRVFYHVATRAKGKSLEHRWNKLIRVGTCMPWTIWLVVKMKLPIRVRTWDMCDIVLATIPSSKLPQELLLVGEYQL